MADRRPDDNELITGPIARTLLLFALPTLGSNVLQSLNGSINAIWVGNMLGAPALAATSNANTIMFLMFAAVFGLAMATTILIGQASGAGDTDRVRRILGSSVGLVIAIAAISGAAGWTEAPALLKLLATPPVVLPLAVAYLRMIFLGLPFLFTTVLLSSALRGTGDSVTPFRAMILSVVLDAGLNPFFIRGFGPLPAFGIAGSALASLLASAATTAYLLYFIYAKDLPLRLKGRELGYLRPSRAEAGLIVGKGLPMGASMVVIATSMLAMTGLINRAGVGTMAAYGAISQLWNYVQMPALAVGAGVSAMVAQNIGAGRWDRVNQIAIAGIGINLVLTGAMIALVTVVSREVIGLFLTPSSPAIPIAIHINLLVSWSFLLFGASVVLSAAMRANGAVIAPLVILIVASYPARFGTALLALPYLGTDAIWAGFCVAAVVAMTMTAAWFVWGSWRGERMLAPTAALG